MCVCVCVCLTVQGLLILLILLLCVPHSNTDGTEAGGDMHSDQR